MASKTDAALDAWELNPDATATDIAKQFGLSPGTMRKARSLRRRKRGEKAPTPQEHGIKGGKANGGNQKAAVAAREKLSKTAPSGPKPLRAGQAPLTQSAADDLRTASDQFLGFLASPEALENSKKSTEIARTLRDLHSVAPEVIRMSRDERSTKSVDRAAKLRQSLGLPETQEHPTSGEVPKQGVQKRL